MIIEVDATGPRPPTRKQLDFIEEISDTIKESFEGDTVDEASDWISEHIDRYREVLARRREYDTSHLEDFGDLGDLV